MPHCKGSRKIDPWVWDTRVFSWTKLNSDHQPGAKARICTPLYPQINVLKWWAAAAEKIANEHVFHPLQLKTRIFALTMRMLQRLRQRPPESAAATAPLRQGSGGVSTRNRINAQLRRGGRAEIQTLGQLSMPSSGQLRLWLSGVNIHSVSVAHRYWGTLFAVW